MSSEINRVFISYRRDDSRWLARALYNKLTSEIDEERVFMDVDSIEPGLDFVDVIDDVVSKVNVMIAIIGPGFMTATDEDGGRLIDDPQNWVRLEIATALKRNIRVIPLLQQGANLPTAEELPEDLKPLVRRNAIQVNEMTFEADVDRIIDSLQRFWNEEQVAAKGKPSKPTPSLPTPDTSDAEPIAALPGHNSLKRPAWLIPALSLAGVLAVLFALWATGVFSSLKPENVVTKPNSENDQPSQPDAQKIIQQEDEKQPIVEGLVWIEPGEFMMNSPTNEGNIAISNRESRKIEFENGFYMGETEVTRLQYWDLMEKLDDKDQPPVDGSLPKTNITWIDAIDFCDALNDGYRANGIGELPDGFEYRLPSEAEWEYACRAGNDGTFTDRDIRNIAYCRFDNNLLQGPVKVKSKKPNEWNLFDMLGNVEEWCRDIENNDHYVLRGGGYNALFKTCQPTRSYRTTTESAQFPSGGFRIAAFKKSPTAN